MASRKKLKKSKISEKQIMKRKVRASSEWAALRELIRKEQKLDPISLRPLSRTFNLHHLSQDDRFYNDLTSDRFKGVNDYSHRVLHYIYDIVKREGTFEVLNRIRTIVEEMIKITEMDKTRYE